MKKSGKLLIILNVLVILVMEVLADIAGAVIITEFPLPFPFSVPVGITAGPDGNVWFTEQSGNNIGQITPAGVISEFEVPPNPTFFDVPLGITTGPDGNLWFTESFAASIGQITTSGNVSSFPISTASQPFWIASGSDGNLWFTEESFPSDIGLIGQITPAGVITESPVPTANSMPFGITLGPDGNIWFTEATGNNIAQITPTGVVTEFPIPTANSMPFGITTGPDGNIWFTEGNGNNIGRITPAGVITESPVPTANSLPFGITTGPDGNLWFTEATGNNIGQITPAGIITEFPVPTANSQPFGITTGPDGNLWFTEGNGNNIGLAVINNVATSVPTAQQFFVQSPVVTPVTTTTTQSVALVSIRPPRTVRASSVVSMESSSILAPIGIGPVAAGGNILNIVVGLGKFSGPVDIYFAIFMPAIDPVNIYILTQSGVQTLDNAGLVPWIPNTLGSLYVPLTQNIPVSQILPGTYTLYLVVTPAGNLGSFYFWQTSFTL